jgi:hypothetical protein
MQKTMEVFEYYLEKGQVIHPEDIREVTPETFTRSCFKCLPSDYCDKILTPLPSFFPLNDRVSTTD